MAVHKAIRSNPLAQPARRRHNPDLKTESLDNLHHLNRGFAIALAALDRLERKDRLQKPAVFPRDCLRNYRNRMEALRALANRDLLRLLAGREDQDAARFGRLWGQPDKRNPRP